MYCSDLNLSYLDVERSLTDTSVSACTNIYPSLEFSELPTNTNDIFDVQCSPKSQITKSMVSNCIHFNHSYKSLEGMAKLINTTSDICVQDTKFKIKKMIDPLITTEFYILCDSCQIYSATTATHVKCSRCSQLLKRVNSKYFVNLPLKTQLIKVIEDHFEDILSYDQKFSGSVSVIRDVQDGLEYRKVKQKYPDYIILSLSVNTDGAQIFHSSHKSIWPIQFYLNFRQPNIRYIPENILVAAIHEGNVVFIQCVNVC